jgi:hypothetical protein
VFPGAAQKQRLTENSFEFFDKPLLPSSSPENWPMTIVFRGKTRSKFVH